MENPNFIHKNINKIDILNQQLIIDYFGLLSDIFGEGMGEIQKLSYFKPHLIGDFRELIKKTILQLKKREN